MKKVKLGRRIGNKRDETAGNASDGHKGRATETEWIEQRTLT